MAVSTCIEAPELDKMDYGRPTKRSLTISGHETSLSLEPAFWRLLEQAAGEEGCALVQLVARIDEERFESRPTPNLTSAVRQWLLHRVQHGLRE